MKKVTVTLLITLVLTVMMVMSTGVAGASWGWEDTTGGPTITKSTKSTGSGSFTSPTRGKSSVRY